MGATETLAEFIANTTYSQLPRETIDIAKKAILDCLGTTLAGSQGLGGKIVTEYVREQGGNPEAGVIAGGFKTSTQLAALANGTMGHALDYDDYSAGGWMVHPSVILLPPTLALSEKNNFSGKDILEAYLVGFEVGSKIGSGLQAEMGHFKAGWHSTGTVGTVGSAVAAAKILKLNAQQCRMSLGIACSLASGLRQNFGTNMKPFHAGFSSSKGIMAAILARKGFTADPTILEAPIGYAKIYNNLADVNLMTAKLGAPFDIVSSPGLSFKPYPCCAAAHCHLDAILHLIRNSDIDAKDVSEVICVPHSAVVPGELIHHQPKTVLQAKFSLEYCMAVALLDKKAGLDQFTDERVAKSDVQSLMPKVRYEYPPDMTTGHGRGKPSKITIKFNDGRELSHVVYSPKGDPANPMTQEDVANKFKDCAKRTLSAKNIDYCIDTISNLESLKDVNPLMQILTAAKAK